jgi:dihydroorotase
MKILIKKAKIIDAKSAFHNQIVDVKISNGIIEEIAKTFLY